MRSLDVVRLPISLLDPAVDVLVRSFAADPGLLFVLPDRVAREQLAPTMARALLQFVVRTGTPYCTWEPVRGVALWFPPGPSPPSEEDFSATGMSGIPGQIGAEPWMRFKQLAECLEAFHPQYAPEPHWYLAMLGVDPEWQRQGIGELLMQPVFDAADRDGIPCYLEAPTLENALYYQRRGFRVVGETDVPGSSVHIWMMRRDPSRHT
ncbi:GNAT family N-acetyltransferase [Mesorhizobium sophorae]|uniref:GNAT family N-acetyltransferase n=1 Tax=Mesorhizobium sophorae TaxID=1300294 RepID=UPI00117BE1BB|nr:GNAT family N-acetyltransferase [Mesorhizobium sophorae]